MLLWTNLQLNFKQSWELNSVAVWAKIYLKNDLLSSVHTKIFMQLLSISSSYSDLPGIDQIKFTFKIALKSITATTIP